MHCNFAAHVGKAKGYETNRFFPMKFLTSACMNPTLVADSSSHVLDAIQMHVLGIAITSYRCNTNTCEKCIEGGGADNVSSSLRRLLKALKKKNKDGS